MGQVAVVVVTNEFTITVESPGNILFIVDAEVQNGSTDGTVIGTAQTDQSGASFSVIAGRTDLVCFDGADLKVTNSADLGGVGTTNYYYNQSRDWLTNQ